jgi:hypothetical protein
MARQAQNQSTVSNAVPSRDDFVREYMQQLSANKPPKVSLASRIANAAVTTVADAVEHSRVGFGEIQAAWEISGTRAEIAYAKRHARFAELQAIEMGLK